MLLDGAVVVAVEVKTRRSHDHGSPLEAVTPTKAERVARLAWRWVVEHEVRSDGVRVDLVGVLRPPTATPSSSTCGGSADGDRGRSHTVVLQGALGHVVDVQVDVSPGQVGTTLVGRPDASISESRDRCRTAVSNSGFHWPVTKRVTVLLSPADLPKRGSHFDLAIAWRRAGGRRPTRSPRDVLDGFRPDRRAGTGRAGCGRVPGVLPMW